MNLVDSWIERPTGIWEAIGLIPVGDSGIFLCPAPVTKEVIYELAFYNFARIHKIVIP